MSKTSKFSVHSIGIPQHGTNWCIPASIENLLRSEQITNLTQEEIIHQYLLQNAPIQSLVGGGQLDLRTLQRSEVLELFRCPTLPNASFQTFAPIVNGILAKSGTPIRLSYKDNILPVDYVKEVDQILSNDKAVLISAGHARGWHITIVYEWDGTRLWSYDPGRDTHIDDSAVSYNFSHDILFIG